MPFAFALLAAAPILSAYSGPRPEETAIFQNWITGCDNVRNCSAISLAPAGDGGNFPDHLELVIEQPVAHHHYPTVTVRFPLGLAEPALLDFRIDSVSFALPAAAGGKSKLTGARARAVVAALRKGSIASLFDSGGAEIARTSLSGLSASLLRIDEQQGKADTTAALGRPGTRGANGNSPGYSVTIGRSRNSWRPPTQPARRLSDTSCDQSGSAAIQETSIPSLVRLDGENTMAIVTRSCLGGPYTRYSEIMIINDTGEVRQATFDFDNGIVGDGPSNVQAEAVWLEEERILESASRFRAIGDCGVTSHYIWDGSKFRLSEQLVMPECRGARDRIRVWKVDVVDR